MSRWFSGLSSLCCHEFWCTQRRKAVFHNCLIRPRAQTRAVFLLPRVRKCVPCKGFKSRLRAREAAALSQQGRNGRSQILYQDSERFCCTVVGVVDLCFDFCVPVLVFVHLRFERWVGFLITAFSRSRRVDHAWLQSPTARFSSVFRTCKLCSRGTLVRPSPEVNDSKN